MYSSVYRLCFRRRRVARASFVYRYNCKSPDQAQCMCEKLFWTIQTDINFFPFLFLTWTMCICVWGVACVVCVLCVLCVLSVLCNVLPLDLYR